MDRNRNRHAAFLLPLWLVTTLFTSASGCSAVATILYVAKGTNVGAEFKGLKDKRVAVVCRPVIELDYRNGTVAKELAVAVGQLLKEHVRKIELIDPREVDDWSDENDWYEFTEVGEALGADIVVAIDLEQFGLYESLTLYKGRAETLIQVFDMNADSQRIWKKHPPASEYPPNISLDRDVKDENEFRAEYIQVLATEIARHFYAHDTRVDFAKDTVAYRE